MNDFRVNPPTMEAVQAFVLAAVEARRVVSRRTGLSELEMAALERVGNDPSSPGELARVLRISTAASTGLVDRLEQHGHVERRAHPGDRRRTDVHITESGRTEVISHLRPMLEGLIELDAALDDDERVVVERYLRGVIAAFGRIEDPET